MTMAIHEARNKLKELADKRYRSVKQEIIDLSSGAVQEEDRVYIDGFGGCTGGSFEECFEKLKRIMEGDNDA